MSHSLNESRSLALKAARGAGYDWGIAQDAGRAVFWLWQAGQDGSRPLAELLQYGYATALDAHSCVSLDMPLRGLDKLCPLLLGASLSDLAAKLKARPIEAFNVTCPVLLLPFAGMAARVLNQSVDIHIDGDQVTVDATRSTLRSRLPEHAEYVTLHLSTRRVPVEALGHRAYPSADTLRILSEFAERTYAPATEESRVLGAGSGISDND
ncbi:MAG: DUF3726 domain-containing protein [Pseudomonadota bacterium]